MLNSQFNKHGVASWILFYSRVDFSRLWWFCVGMKIWCKNESNPTTSDELVNHVCIGVYKKFKTWEVGTVASGMDYDLMKWYSANSNKNEWKHSNMNDSVNISFQWKYHFLEFRCILEWASKIDSHIALHQMIIIPCFSSFFI